MLRTGLVTVLALMACLLLASGQPEGDRDEFGAPIGERRAATGYFRVMRVGGRWWLVDPNGYLFLAAGVEAVSVAGRSDVGEGGLSYRERALEKHGSESAWAEATAVRLREWGFNTVGPGSDHEVREAGLAFTVNLGCSRAVRRADVGLFPDVFDPYFERGVQRHVSRACRQFAEDRRLLGYFTDGHLDWGGGGNGLGSLMARFLSMEDDAPGRRGVLDFLERRYLTIEELNEAWATSYASFEEVGRTPQVGSRIPQADLDGFQQLVAQEYFRITHDAIRACDRHHLILGPRFEGEAPAAVLSAMGDAVSVVSVEWAGGRPTPPQLRRMQRLADRPVVVCGLAIAVSPVGRGEQARARACVETEQEQAGQLRTRVRELLAVPTVVGYEWRSYADEGGGRGRCGLVDVEDEPHEALVAAARQANAGMYRAAGGANGG